jgi:hypothetical protein
MRRLDIKAICPKAPNGTGVGVGGRDVAVGSGVGGTGVGVGGRDVAVGSGVGGTGVGVGGFDVGDDVGTSGVDGVAGVPQPLSASVARMNPIPKTSSLLLICCSFSLICRGDPRGFTARIL